MKLILTFKTFQKSVRSFGVFLILCAVKSDVLCRRKRIRMKVRGRPAAVCTPRCPKPSRPSSLKNWPRRRATWVHTHTHTHTQGVCVCVWTRRAAGLCSKAWGLRHRPTKSCWNPTRLNAPQTSVRTVETRSDTQKEVETRRPSFSSRLWWSLRTKKCNWTRISCWSFMRMFLVLFKCLSSV